MKWIKVWKNDLLSSVNFKTLSAYEKGIYLLLLMLCRDDDYPGQLCWPNGEAMTLDDIIDAMGLKQGERRDRIKEAIETLKKKEMIIENERGVLEIRKYSEKVASKFHRSSQEVVKKLSGSSQEVVKKLSGSCQEVVKPPIDNQSLTQKTPVYIDKEEEEDKEEELEGPPIVPQNNLEIEMIIKLLEFCKTPNRATKYKYIEDLIRQGITPQRIISALNSGKYNKYDFFEIIRDLAKTKTLSKRMSNLRAVLEEIKNHERRNTNGVHGQTNA